MSDNDHTCPNLEFEKSKLSIYLTDMLGICIVYSGSSYLLHFFFEYGRLRQPLKMGALAPQWSQLQYQGSKRRSRSMTQVDHNGLLASWTWPQASPINDLDR